MIRLRVDAKKSGRAALRLLPPITLIVGCVLVGWGVDDLSALFSNQARSGLIVVLFAAYLASVLLGVEANPFGKGQTCGRRWPIMVGILTVPLLLAAVSRSDRRDFFVFPDLPWLRWIGVAAFAIGDVVRLAALRELGRNYSVFITIQPQHELVRTGPYRIVRHPFYLGTLLTAPGMMLVFRSPLAPLIFVLSIVFVVSRINREEKLLIGEFPETYPAYRRSSWRLLPYIY